MKRRHRDAFAVLFLLIGSLTVQAGSPAARNIMVIVKAEFDDATHRFPVSWKLDTTGVPAGCEAAFTALPGTDKIPSTPPDYSFPVTSLSADTAFEIKALRFDTTYRVGMWLQLQGLWIPPDSSSMITITIPAATWEQVRLFDIPRSDTLALLQEQVFLWRDASYGNDIPVHPDTVRCYDLPAARLKGFRKEGTGFRFIVPVSSPPFFIGFRYDSPETSSAPVGIFRDSSGRLLAEHEAVRDTGRHLIYLKTDRIGFPFLLLADTLTPRVEFTSDTGRVIGSKPLDLVFFLRDNSANCAWRLFSGTGDDPPFHAAAAFSGVLQDTVQKISCQIPVTGTQTCGLRIYLTTDDGTTADTINVSHQAARFRSNETTTPAGTIVPLAPAALLDSTGCRSALRALFKSAGGEYSRSIFRFYRWQPSPGNTTAENWLEYSSGSEKRFSFLPGSLFWLITRDEVMIDLGNGRSPSLKDTLTIDLPSGVWTDCSSPYGFPVAFSAILAATGAGASSLHCYRWSKDNKRRTYKADQLYCGGVPGFDSPSTLLSYGTNGYFTIYNPSSAALRLCIPPVAAVQTAGASPKVLAGEPAARDWSIRFSLRQQNSVVAGAICAASAGRTTPLAIPPPLSFGGPTITVGQPGDKSSSGTLVLPLHENNRPLVFELTISNPTASPVTITCSPELAAGNANGVRLCATSILPLFEPFTATINARGSEKVSYRISASGETDGFSSPGRTPGPAPRITLLPYKANNGSILVIRINSPVRRNSIELFDLNGRRRCAAAGCSPGNGTDEYLAAVHLNAAPHGCYIVRLTTVADDGTTQHLMRHFIFSR